MQTTPPGYLPLRGFLLFKGASLRDPSDLRSAGLDANATRAIDTRDSETFDATALQDLAHGVESASLPHRDVRRGREGRF